MWILALGVRYLIEANLVSLIDSISHRVPRVDRIGKYDPQEFVGLIKIIVMVFLLHIIR